MDNAMHDESAILANGDADDSEHPAGRISVSGRTRAGARARALAGLTLGMSAFMMVTNNISTSVSHQSIVG